MASSLNTPASQADENKDYPAEQSVTHTSHTCPPGGESNHLYQESLCHQPILGQEDKPKGNYSDGNEVPLQEIRQEQPLLSKRGYTLSAESEQEESTDNLTPKMPITAPFNGEGEMSIPLSSQAASDIPGESNVDIEQGRPWTKQKCFLVVSALLVMCVVVISVVVIVTIKTNATGKTAVPALKPRLDLIVTTPAGSRYGPVVALPGGEALLADHGPDPDQVVWLDRHGRVVPPAFTCSTKEWISGLVLDKDNVYVVQSGGTISKTRLSSLNHTTAEWQVPGVSSVHPGTLVGTELYLVDSSSGIAFSNELKSNNKAIRKTGLHRPRSITTAITDENKTLFIISEYSVHRISIFNATWDLISTIGGQAGFGDSQLYNPSQVVVTPWSTLLVANLFHGRVTEFSLSGHFLRKLLTTWERLLKLWYISYSHPYLWVVHANFGGGPFTVRCYQLVPKHKTLLD